MGVSLYLDDAELQADTCSSQKAAGRDCPGLAAAGSGFGVAAFYRRLLDRTYAVEPKTSHE